MSATAIKEAYGIALRDLGAENKDVVVLETDVGSSTRSILFGNEYPERYFNVGIAEANMCAVAAGLALGGKIPFVNTFAAFMSTRALDPINSLIAYPKLNVKIAASYAGLSDAYDGPTHHSISDIAIMRSIPNMSVICVSDAAQTKKAVTASVNINEPVYIRLSRAVVDDVFDEDSDFEFGKGILIRDGCDVTLVATGYMLQKTLEAADQLSKKGIGTRVVNIHTIKPIDEDILVQSAQKTDLIVTVEEHSVIGGLGAAVAEVLSQKRPTKIIRIGIDDTYAETGEYEALFAKYGLSSSTIANKVEHAVKTK